MFPRIAIVLSYMLHNVTELSNSLLLNTRHSENIYFPSLLLNRFLVTLYRFPTCSCISGCHLAVLSIIAEGGSMRTATGGPYNGY